MPFANAGLFARYWDSLGLKFLIREAQPQKIHVFTGASLDPYAGWKEFLRRKEISRPKPPVQEKTGPGSGGLPQPWLELLGKTRKGYYAFTYWELGEDLQGGSGTQKDLRRQMLGKLIQFLSLPAGSITFWPSCLNGDHYSNIPFWNGLRLLGCRGLVIFGSNAAVPILQQKKVRPLAFRMKNGFLIWVMRSLPAFEAESVKNFEWGYLRNGLEKFLRDHQGGEEVTKS